MTTARVVETSVTNNSLSQDYPNLVDHAKHIIDFPFTVCSNTHQDH